MNIKSASNLLWIVVAAALLTACGPTDPEDPMYWVDKFHSRERKEAIRHLASMGEKAQVAVPALIKLYKKGKEKGEVVVTLAEIKAKGPEVVEVFAQAISDATEQDAAAAAAEALGDLGAKDKIKELLAVLDMDMQDEVKAAVLRTLVKFKDPSTVDPLIRILDRDPDKQWIHLNALACEALGEIGSPAADKAVPAIVRGLFLRDRFSRLAFRECAIAMIKLGEVAAKGMLDAMDGKNQGLNELAKKKGFVDGLIAEEGVKVLALLRYKPAVPRILKELVVHDVPPAGYDDKKKTLWAAIEAQRFQNAIDALGRIGDPRAIPELSKWLYHGEYLRRVRVPWALNMIGGEQAYKELLKAAQTAKVDDNTWFRLDCAQHLAYLAGPEQLPDLKKVLKVVEKLEKPLKEYRATDPAGAKDFLDKLAGFKANIEAIEECGEKVDCWIGKLEGKHHHVREKAVWFLARHKSDPKAMKALLDNVGTEEFEFRNSILQVLPIYCDQSCVKPLAKLIEEEKGKAAVKGFRDVMQFVLVQIESRAGH